MLSPRLFKVYVTWVAFSFGIHKKPKKFLRAIQIFQDQVLIRGHGVSMNRSNQLPAANDD